MEERLKVCMSGEGDQNFNFFLKNFLPKEEF